jgi:hypothetical protein
MNKNDTDYMQAAYQRECALADLTLEAKMYYNVNPEPNSRLARAAVRFGQADAILKHCRLAAMNGGSDE